MNQYRKSPSDFRLIQVLLHVCMIMSQNSKWIHYVDTIYFRKRNKLKKKSRLMLQSRTKLLENVFPIMFTFLRNKTISKTTPLRKKKNPSPNSMLLPTNAKGSGFPLNTQQHCFQGKGEREEPVQLWCFQKCCPSIQFSQQFCPRL